MVFVIPHQVNFYIMETTVTDVSPNMECSGADNSILGNPDDPESVAWLVQLALNYQFLCILIIWKQIQSIIIVHI